MRIVSLLPSATELISALGLDQELVGVTHECDYPAQVRSLPKVTRTLVPTDAPSDRIDELVQAQLAGGAALYSLDFDALEALAPDLIVTQALCGVCAVSEAEVMSAACRLARLPTVINLEPTSLGDVFDSVVRVAQAAGVPDAGLTLRRQMDERVEAVKRRARSMPTQPRTAVLEWLDPPYSTGHWGPELVRLAGGVEGLGREGEPSRRLDWSEVVAWNPEVVLIACCGFSVERTLEDIPILLRAPGWSATAAAAAGRVFVTDGAAYFSRPGPRLVDSLEIVAHAMDPLAHPPPEAGQWTLIPVSDILAKTHESP